jgi:hypothetical protein
MDWRDIKLNDDGNELIYETPGDADRGNPLDIVSVAKVYGGEDVTGFKIPRKEFRDELLLRWNTYLELRSALENLVGAYQSMLAHGWHAMPAVDKVTREIALEAALRVLDLTPDDGSKEILDLSAKLIQDLNGGAS